MIYTLAAEDSLLNPALFRDWGTAGILIFVMLLFGVLLLKLAPKILQGLSLAFEIVKTQNETLKGAKELLDQLKDLIGSFRGEHDKLRDEREKFAEERRKLQNVVSGFKSKTWSANPAHEDHMHQTD
jgi:hypothetical protein